VHALIFTAVYSRHMFVWLTFSQTLVAVIAGCEAAWRFFGVFKVVARRARRAPAFLPPRPRRSSRAAHPAAGLGPVSWIA
jgi:hypothetical protein